MIDVLTELLMIHSNTWKCLIVCKQKWLMLNRIISVKLQYFKPFNCVQKKKSAQVCLKILCTKLFTNHVYYKCIKRIWH